MATTTSASHPLLPSVELSLLNSYVLMLLGMPSSMRDLEVLLFAQVCFSVLASCSTDVLDLAGSRRVSTLLSLLELRLRRPSLSRRHLLLPSRPLLMQLQLLSRRGLLHRLLRSFISLISLRRLRRRSRWQLRTATSTEETRSSVSTSRPRRCSIVLAGWSWGRDTFSRRGG